MRERVKYTAVLIAVILPTAINLAIVARGYDGGPYLRGDCPYYYATAISLLRDRDLDLGNQLPPNALSGGVALATDGRIVPKHPILLPIVSAPFIGALGMPGALVFNLVQFTVLLWFMFALAQAAGSRPWIAAAAVVLTYAGTSLPHYAWNYSPDLLAATVLCGATVAAARAESQAGFFLAGALCGLSVAAKYPLLLCVPGVALIPSRWTQARAAAFASGLLLPLAGLAWQNTHLFGAPWITSYDRIAYVDGGRVTVYSQRSDFIEPLVSGMRGQLFDRQHGLLTTSPVTLISILGVARLARMRPRLAAHVAVASLALFLFYSAYREWPASHYGNRFLLPAAALCVAPLAVFLQTVADARHRTTRRAGRAQTSTPDPTAV